MTTLADQVDGVIGVDTHRDTLTAAAVSGVGGVLGQLVVTADAVGYQQLLNFAYAQIPGRRCYAVEGAGSYGVGLTRLLVDRGEWVVEVDRPKRPARRRSVAARWCSYGASVCGAVVSQLAAYGPGPSKWPRSGLGRC